MAETDQVETASEQEGSSSRAPVDLPKGKAMTFEGAYSITAASRARLIVLAGAPKSGKTTLISSIFHAFQRGPFVDYWFSGSSSLLGFDERCHDARLSSGRTKPTTERTKAGTKNLLLHLQLRLRAVEPPKDLLFLDMSGEDYDDARNSVDECRKLAFIRRADHFILLIDGERLSDNNQRQQAKTDALTLLRSCFDSGQLTSRSLVDVLISKWDIAEGGANKASATTFATLLEKQIVERFASLAARLRIARVAARPEHGNLPIAYGLDQVFPQWVEDIPQRFQRLSSHKTTKLFTEFDRFSLTATP